MITGVKYLCDIAGIQDTAFGNKAVNLSKAMAAGVSVLSGFCVTFEVDRDIDVQIEKFSNDIQKFFQELHLEIGKKYPLFIVRSSFELEDTEFLQFPGVFQSVHGVENFGQLLKAIKICCKSLWEDGAKEYMRLHGQKYEYHYFTVMVQPEQPSEYSGVASSFVPWGDRSDDGMMLVQLTQGVNHKFVKGVGQFNSYTVFPKDAERISYRQIRAQIKMDTEKERALLRQLYDVLTVLTNDFGADIGIEWGIHQDELYVFQIRSICFQRNIEKHRDITFFCEDEEQGFKYQAMKYFYKNSLFPAKVLLFEKRAGMLEIKKGIEQLKRGMPITVRFSSQNEIGLPRCFAKKPEDALQYIFDTRQEQWSMMIYNSIQVQDSYELYIDRDSIILEHIPGMWESDSQLYTDTIYVKETQTDYWLAQNERLTKHEDAEGITWRTTRLFSRNDADELLQRISPWVEKLRKDFVADLPLNFHFVSDSTDFYFLNCRVTGEIKGKSPIPDELYTVSCIEDLKGWDGRSSILFEPSLERGEEVFLTEFVPFLRKLKVPVYVKFGILSHPAIMLREFGIEIRPLFLRHVHYIETRGGKFMDSENPFLTKIMFEEQYCQDDLFSVVQDIDPIVSGHYMIYSRGWLPSMADCNYSDMVRFIEGTFTEKAKIPYTYFERGRASFCTSMQGVKHGHGHLVPHFTDHLADIFPYGKVEKYENMEEAYRHVAMDGQYLIWGNVGEEFYIINEVEEIPKRAIRNTIRTYVE